MRSVPIWLFRFRALVRRLRWRLRDHVSGAPQARLAAPPPQPRARLRVGFIVCTSAKWGLDSVVAALRDRPEVACGFYPTLSDVDLRRSPAQRRANYARERAFFAARAPILADLYDTGRDAMMPAEAIDCDIAFIQQPWGMQDLSRRLAGRVRTAYVHYGMPVIANDRMQSGLPDFHPFLWRYFAATEPHAARIRAGGMVREAALRVTGHPKFDIYHSPAPARDAVALWPHASETGRMRVIYAPHHGLGPGTLQLGTFAWSGPAMLDLARRHSEVDFIFRPHPNLGLELARSGVMRADQWQSWLQSWQEGPNTALSLDGGYFDMFRTSDLLITDSGSFLAEYLPTNRPLLRLVRDEATPLNDFGQRLAAGFYTARDPAQMEALFHQIAQGHDPLAPARAQAAGLLRPGAMRAAEAIAEDLIRGGYDG